MDSHKGAQWGFPDCFPLVARVARGCFRDRETLLRRETSIAHHAFMSTTGEIGAAPGERSHGALTAPTGVAP
ncbi:hypothetical protein SY2F82_67350 [Streptomyces sp. Y2F8-2]|nr:hypothetical protein SY2F82_67350 [Streptomyces sp. Y2F8-2]